MREIVLVRHGETDWNRERRMQGHADIPLNETGRAQAAAVAQRFAGQRFDGVVSSDLIRASATASAIGDAVGHTPVLSPDWRELGVGEAEGVQGFSFGGRIRELMATPDGLGAPLTPGGESLIEFRTRLRRAWDALEGDRLLVVSHGGAIKAILIDLLDLAPERMDAFSLRINTGVTIVRLHDDRPQITLLNCGRHLAE